MIPSLREIIAGLYGALRLLRGDPDGLALFDDSDQGFWRSFFAAVLVAPGYIAFAHFDPRPMSAGTVRIVMVEAIAFVIVWAAFPLAMYHFTRAIGRAERYRLHIVAYNWSQVIQTVIASPLLLGARHSGVVPEATADLLSLVVLLALGLYEWFIARSALKLPGFGALAVVMLSFLIVLVMSDVSYMLLR